jgi:hypothetical protein
MLRATIDSWRSSLNWSAWKKKTSFRVRRIAPIGCARRERPRHRRAAEQRDELATPHSMT